MNNFDKYLEILEEHFNPNDLVCETLEDVAKQFEQFVKEDVDKFLLFEVLHDRYELNYCDDCKSLHPTEELMWNSQGCVCTYCYEDFNENDKKLFDEGVED